MKKLFNFIFSIIIMGAIGYGSVYAWENIINAKDKTSNDTIPKQVQKDNNLNPDGTINFKDLNFKQKVRTLLDTDKLELTPEDVEKIKELDLKKSNVSNIAGMEYFTSLETLNLEDNYIEDINNLRNITSLKVLTLNNNKIINIEPLSNLIDLKELYIAKNLIKNISPLENLINIEKLSLYDNRITDIKVLENLTNLSIFPSLALNPIMDYTIMSKRIDTIFDNWSKKECSDCTEEVLKEKKIYYTILFNEEELGLKELKKVHKEIIKDNMTDLEKEYAIINYLIDKITYKESSFTSNSDIYNVFINNVGTYHHYALSFSYLATLSGLDNYIVSSENHTWNIVKIDDTYYQVDITSTDKEIPDYRFINISDKTMNTTHGFSILNSFKYPSTNKDMPISLQEIYYKK